MDKYNLVDYFDVWYNDEEGWFVNNLCKEGIIELENYASTNEILIKLKQIGFLKENVGPERVEIWNDYEMIELFDASTQEPICRLELIRD